MTDALLVTGAMELGGKNTGACRTAKQTQVENKQQVVVGDGDGTDLGSAELTDHDVIQK